MLLRKDEALVFDAMDAFITDILAVLKEHGGRAVRVFPPAANVLLSFSERVANEVVRRSRLKEKSVLSIIASGSRIHYIPPHPSARNLK